MLKQKHDDAVIIVLVGCIFVEFVIKILNVNKIIYFENLCYYIQFVFFT